MIIWRAVIGVIGAVMGLIAFLIVFPLIAPNGLNVGPDRWYLEPTMALVFMVFGASIATNFAGRVSRKLSQFDGC